MCLLLDKHNSSGTEALCLSKITSIQTDFGEGDSYQKVVCFNFDGSLLVTGGCDGVVRIWKVHARIFFSSGRYVHKPNSKL